MRIKSKSYSHTAFRSLVCMFSTKALRLPKGGSESEFGGAREVKGFSCMDFWYGATRQKGNEIEQMAFFWALAV